MWAAIGRFIGAILQAILPDLLKQSREARNVDFAGYDSDLQKDIDTSIENEYGFLTGEQFREEE